MRKITSLSTAVLGISYSFLFSRVICHNRAPKYNYLSTSQKLFVKKMNTCDRGDSIHAAHIQDIHNVPFNVLIRPFPPELDEEKVHSLMETLQVYFQNLTVR